MSVPPQSKPEQFLDKAHHVVQRMMGVKKRIDPRKVDGPVYANLSDRLVASALDTGFLVTVFADLFNWMSIYFYQGIQVDAVFKIEEGMQSASLQSQLIALYHRSVELGFLQMWLLNSFVQSVIAGICLVLMWHYCRITPGKWIVGLKFADSKTNEEPTLKQYIIRFLGFYVSMPFFMIGFVTLGLNKRRQAWHDMLAGTVVIYSKQGSVFRQLWDLFRKYVLKKDDAAAQDSVANDNKNKQPEVPSATTNPSDKTD